MSNIVQCCALKCASYKWGGERSNAQVRENKKGDEGKCSAGSAIQGSLGNTTKRKGTAWPTDTYASKIWATWEMHIVQ